MRYFILIFIFSIFTVDTMAQSTSTEDLPYYEIPQDYDSYTAGTVAARMVDALGFRYRWATETLRDEDLSYQPSDSARTTLETIDHVLDLSRIILNATSQVANERGVEKPVLTYEEKRKETLENLQNASLILQSATDLSQFKIIFVSPKGESRYPFWNNINGPIADAIWHAGQIASFRRSSGNPINPKVNFLKGKVKVD